MAFIGRENIEKEVPTKPTKHVTRIEAIANAIRDVLLASLNKGQFLTAILGLIILAIIVRLPPEELAKLVQMMIENLISGYLLGYLLFIAACGGWFLSSKFLRTAASKEQKRIGNEKSELQRRSGLGKKVRSSRK